MKEHVTFERFVRAFKECGRGEQFSEIGLDFVLERSVNEDATTGIAPATKSVAEKGGFNV